MMRQRIMKLFGLALVAGVALVACGIPDSTGPSTTQTTTKPQSSTTDPADELAAAKQRWSENGPDTYWLRLVNDCGECDPSMREPQTAVIWAGEPTGSDRRTVEDLFAEIDAAIAEGRNVEVSYHPELGHPTEISIDMQDRAFDGGYHLLIEDLITGLPGEDVALDALEEARSSWQDERPEAYEFRTTIHCECEIDGRIRTLVDGNRIVDWEVDYQQETDTPISPLTIDMMFDDLAEMLSLSEGIESDGVRFTGSASYHPEMGYPTWIGLDIEILDPDSELAFLPPRLVFSVDQFTPVEPADDFEPVTEAEQALSRWEASGPVSYRYELRIHDVEDASFTDPYVVTVSDGAIAVVEYQGEPVDDYPTMALPIDVLLDYLIEQAASGDTVDGLYDEELGYPVFIVVRDAVTARPELLSIHELTPID